MGRQDTGTVGRQDTGTVGDRTQKLRETGHRTGTEGDRTQKLGDRRQLSYTAHSTKQHKTFSCV